MLSVKTNLLAMNADRQLGTNTKKNAKFAEKLSSGYRINRAADDAAGLAISEKMRRQIRGLHQSVDNINDGIGYVQTAEGALNEVHDMLQRINELAVKSANGTNTEEDRSYIDSEVQAIKKEMDRIFTTTEFNERRIWEPSGEREIIGYDSKQAVTFQGSRSRDFKITNENCGVIAVKEDRYTINADASGVSVSWRAYNGTDYTTETIDWDTLKKKNYTFDISDYFGGEAKHKELYHNGKPVFTHEVSFSVAEGAGVDDIIACIDGVTMLAEASTGVSVRFEDASGNACNYFGVSLWSPLLYPGVAYVSHEKDKTNGYSFNDAGDEFLEPVLSNGTNITKNPLDASTTADAAKTNTDKWELKFNIAGIGTATAVSYDTNYYYYDNNRRPEWVYTMNNEGALSSVMEAIPEILAKGNGGSIELNFELKSDTPYQYGKTESSSVAVFTVRFDVNKPDTEQTVFERIKNALTSNMIIDFYTTTGNLAQDFARIYLARANERLIDVPIYGGGKGGTCNFFVQAGAEAGQHIDIEYESLNLAVLGLTDTNVLTAEDSDAAINEVKNAMQIVSKQRSDFGAYQNRLEHAVNINRNVEENTQAAESLIRDTDIAEMMMEYSVNNILLQAGTSMLSQANQSKQLVLELLN